MLKSVRIQNYRCLRDVGFHLGPFNVIVGPNASGKTAIADALTSTSISSTDRWRHDQRFKISWYAETTDGKVLQGSNPKALGGTRQKFVLRPSSLRAQQTAHEVYTLDSSGENLANFFDTLSRVDQGKFVEHFVQLVPVYSDIKARAQGGAKRLQFQDRWVPEVWYEPSQVSDGTMLVAAFIAMGFQRDTPWLAVIEDPDQGLHPYLQRHVTSILRKLAQGKLGPKPIQVVCTTHSKAFLDTLEPSEVLFIARERVTGETVLRRAPTENDNWQEVYNRFQQSMGDMWLTGSLGGVPGV